MQHMLAQLGVHEGLITQEEKAFLAEKGYLLLGQIVEPPLLAAIQNRIREILEAEGEQAGFELLDSPHIKHPKEAGADRLADLVNKDPLFDIFYTHPRVLAAISLVLGNEFKLSSLNYRAAKPGMGLQKLHVDWHEPVAPGAYQVCNSIWLLDDFSAVNGATRMVPGSHVTGKLPQDVMSDPFDSHPDQILLEAPAGSVAIFNSHTWHGGTNNRSDKHRRAVHSYFCRRDQPQQVDQMRYIRPETRARLSLAAQQILAV